MGRIRERKPSPQDVLRRREDARAAQAVPVSSRPVTGAGLADLLRRADGGAGSVAPAAARRRIMVGAARDAAEGHADAVASAVTGSRVGSAAHSNGPVAGAFEAPAHVSHRLQQRAGRGRALPPEVRRSLQDGVPGDLGKVAIHTDREAGHLAADVGAEAFTFGRDVYFGSGRFQPHSREGQHLLAHELAHATKGDNTIRRKLAGTAVAIKEMGGGGDEKQRKLLIFKRNTEYTTILKTLEQYEARERKVVAAPPMKKGDSKWMTSTLKELMKLTNRWLEANDELADPEKRAEYQEKLSNVDFDLGRGNITAEQAAAERAETTVQKRVHAMRMLRPRLAAELQDVTRPDYFSTGTYNDTTLDKADPWTKDDAVGGQMNRLDRTAYKGGGKGFFIADRTRPETVADEALASGIDTLDPNQGARSVASYRLAKLFGADVITKIEFATHASATDKKDSPLAAKAHKLGVFSEAAAGTEAAKIKLARNAKETEEFGEETDRSKVVDVNDPELQRSLNILQMLDYISRQLDRHAGNYYIATDESGKVTGIKGIDLDLSFGAKNNQGGNLPAYLRGNFVGVPQLADAAFRAKVLSVSPADVAAVLDGLLSPSEINATVERFNFLCETLRNLDPSKIVPDGGWGEATAAQQTDNTSYLGKLRDATIGTSFTDPAEAVFKAVRAPQSLLTTILNSVKKHVVSGELTPRTGLEIVQGIAHRLQTDPALLDKRARSRELGAVEQAHYKKIQTKVELEGKLASRREKGKETADVEGEISALEAQILAEKLDVEAATAIKKSLDKDYEETVLNLARSVVSFALRWSKQRPKKVEGSANRRAALSGAK